MGGWVGSVGQANLANAWVEGTHARSGRRARCMVPGLPLHLLLPLVAGSVLQVWTQSRVLLLKHVLRWDSAMHGDGGWWRVGMVGAEWGGGKAPQETNPPSVWCLDANPQWKNVMSVSPHRLHSAFLSPFPDTLCHLCLKSIFFSCGPPVSVVGLFIIFLYCRAVCDHDLWVSHVGGKTWRDGMRVGWGQGKKKYKPNTFHCLNSSRAKNGRRKGMLCPQLKSSVATLSCSSRAACVNSDNPKVVWANVKEIMRKNWDIEWLRYWLQHSPSHQLASELRRPAHTNLDPRPPSASLIYSRISVFTLIYETVHTGVP